MIAAAFFLSGFSALVFEINWSRMLTLVFGASVYGQSIVLGMFMGGMTLGARWIGRSVRSSSRPLLWYAVLEGITALFGLASLRMPSLCDRIPALPPALDFSARIACCAFFILPATVAMGGTFPVMFRELSLRAPGNRGAGSASGKISFLYVVNTLGALSGIFACNYWMLTKLGMARSIGLASAVNFSIFALFLALGRSPRGDASKTAGGVPRPKTSAPFRLAPLWALFFSGFLTMLYEIAWSRALTFSFGSSTYTFSLIVFSFIMGLGAGAMWIRRHPAGEEAQTRRRIRDYQLRAIVCSSVFVFFAVRLPLITDQLFARFGEQYMLLHLSEIACMSFIISPVAFFSGASFPLLCTLCDPRGDPPESLVGLAYSFNTAGSILGAFLTGFVFVSLLGPFQVIWIALGLHFLILYLVRPEQGPQRLKTPAIVLAAVSLFLFVQFRFFDPNDLLSGNFAKIYREQKPFVPRYLRRNPAYETYRLKRAAAWEKATPYRLLWFRHGLISSVAVSRNNQNTRLIIDGKTDASTGPFFVSDMPTQSLLAFLPLVSTENPKKGLVIGYGSGVTTGLLSLYVPRIDSLEIEKSVLDASRFFSEYNMNAHQRDNVRVVLGDARRFIHRAPPRCYDFISAEPSNIWMAGVAHLFTVEYFRDCARILKENGVMVQWLHVYKLSATDFKVALRTFSKVFPEVSIWGSPNFGDLFLIGKKGKTPPLLEKRLPEVLENYPYRDAMNVLGAGDLRGFLNFQIAASIDPYRPKLQSVPLHTDNLPILEYSAAKNMFRFEPEKIYRFLERPRPAGESDVRLGSKPQSS
jgi:spermidine synthase